MRCQRCALGQPIDEGSCALKVFTTTDALLHDVSLQWAAHSCCRVSRDANMASNRRAAETRLAGDKVSFPCQHTLIVFPRPQSISPISPRQSRWSIAWLFAPQLPAGVPNPNSLPVKTPILPPKHPGKAGKATNSLAQHLLSSPLSQDTLDPRKRKHQWPTASPIPLPPHANHLFCLADTRPTWDAEPQHHCGALINSRLSRGLQATGVQASSRTRGRIASQAPHRSPESRTWPKRASQRQ